METMKKIGILAFGSLNQDPGVALEPLIVERISAETPFSVEFAKPSKNRGGAPTVLPHPRGKPVAAEI